jgi:GH24 family phage-related lysozyme (muramidase)
MQQEAGMQVGAKATEAIIGFEIGSPEYYNTCCKHPVYPGGASGVTIGIGYDLGQHTAAEIISDWGKQFDADTVRYLSYLSGVTGDGARIRASGLGNLAIPLAAATAVYTETTLPKYAAGTDNALPNCSQLHPDAFGALVSVSYNRGFGGYQMLDDRHKEMRLIHAAMADQDFAAVPELIRQMKRLWQDAEGRPLPGDAGLLTRRDAEAALFEANLPAPLAPVAQDAPAIA